MSILLAAFAVGVLFLVTHNPGEASVPVPAAKKIVTYIHVPKKAVIDPVEKFIEPLKKGIAKSSVGQVNFAQAKLPPAEPSIDPNLHCRLAIAHLHSFPKEKWHNIRFLSWYAVPGNKYPSAERATAWWIHQMSFAPYPVMPQVVPGSNGRLWMIYLDDYRWNAQAWESVALREPYFQQPLIDPYLAQFLRDAIGFHLSKELTDKNLYPVVTIVRADWFFRETVESDRSPSYYDLLYAEQRFPSVQYQWRTEKKTIYHNGGDYRYPDDSGRVSKNVTKGRYEVELKFREKATGKKSDFPANEDDWNAIFGITDTVKFMDRFRINLRHGAVVAGSSDDPLKGSIVTRSNRAIQVIRVPAGVAMKTFDTATTANATDYLQNSPDVIVGDIEFEAGELLASLPNGGQAGLLINGQRNRIERADAEFAHNKIDPSFVDVRTMGSCVQCHASDGGFIPPRDLVSDMLKQGVNLYIDDREKLNDYKAYFLGWESRIKSYQQPYFDLIARTTNRPNEKGWSGGDLTREFLAFRVWYDDPVSLKQAARELGVEPELLRFQLRLSPKARLGLLIQGQTIPRVTWEQELYRDAMFLMKSQRIQK